MTWRGCEQRLRELARVTVAFSGGADSAFLAWVAHDTLGPAAAHAVTAVSPSLAPDERDDCAALAREWGLRWTAVETDELARAEYVANGPDRCYHCKAELMDVVAPLAAAEGATIVLGTNVDDLGDHRPGQQAAAERGAVFPLVEAGFTKDDVRDGVARPRPAHVGQAGGRVPRVATALRHARHGRGAGPRGPRRGRAARAGVPSAPRPALRRRRPRRARRAGDLADSGSNGAPRWSRR